MDRALVRDDIQQIQDQVLTWVDNAEIDVINERVYDAINNGVYKAGFATTSPPTRMPSTRSSRRSTSC